eukprot:SAG22_NODE_444_length_10453_cov_8.586343_8_plen_122_part_00
MFLRWEGTDEQTAAFQAHGGYEWLWESSASLSSNRSRIWAHSMLHNYGDLAGYHGDAPACEEKGCRTYGFDWDDGHQPYDYPVNASNVQLYARMLKEFVLQRKPVYQGPILAVVRSLVTHM